MALSKDRTARRRPICSEHEGYALLLDAVEQLKTQVFEKDTNRNNTKIVKALVQIAALCRGMVEDLNYFRDHTVLDNINLENGRINNNEENKTLFTI